MSKGLREMSKDQKDQAASLREIQMTMLDKAEVYEKERRTQSAELTKIIALLAGKRTEQETIQLAIKSLNISVGALKKTKEIVVEIAAFMSFAAFMKHVADEADTQIKLLNKDKWGGHAVTKLINLSDAFFVTQTAEWLATEIVTEQFLANFQAGWTKLNKLMGKYITGDELNAYLKQAADLLQKIDDERAQELTARIVDLDAARKTLRGDATGERTVA